AGFRQLIVDTGAAQRLVVGSASEDFLETYGVTPILGRGIELGDTVEGAPAAVLLGHAFWQREFGGDRNVLDRSIRIQDKPVTILGVLPAGFYDDTQVWQAEQFRSAALDFRGSGTPVIARLRPGIALDQATRALNAVPVPSAKPGSPPARVILES